MTGGIPFAPSLLLLAGMLRQEIPPISPQTAARTTIAGGRMLSVPVAGGRSALRGTSADIDRLMISDHGRWRREHLGAWSAAYGRAPYFPHLFPLLEEAYGDESHDTLGRFNRALLRIALGFINAEDALPSLRLLGKENPERLSLIRGELTTKVNADLSIFDALFRLGKETLFLLY